MYWQHQYQYLPVKVLAIPIRIVFIESIAIPKTIHSEYVSISKVMFIPIKCMPLPTCFQEASTGLVKDDKDEAGDCNYDNKCNVSTS